MGLRIRVAIRIRLRVLIFRVGTIGPDPVVARPEEVLGPNQVPLPEQVALREVLPVIRQGHQAGYVFIYLGIL